MRPSTGTPSTDTDEVRVTLTQPCRQTREGYPPMTNRDAPAKRYKPSPRDWQYLEALKRFLQMQPHEQTRARLAEMAGMPRTKLSGFEANPTRMAWVREELGGPRRDDQWERLVELSWNRAMTGKLDWAVFFAKAVGRFDPQGNAAGSGAQGPGAGPTVVFLNVPRPDALAEPMKQVGPVHRVPAGVNPDVLDLVGGRR
jgi:hypothetical protein